MHNSYRWRRLNNRSHFDIWGMMIDRQKVGRTKIPLFFDYPQATRGPREPLHGERDRSFRRIILSIPAGKVSTYGKVAAAAGYPRYHRAVARLLRTEPPDQLPWHRVLGTGGEIKLPGAAAKEQRARLKAEGVQFRGNRVDMDRLEYSIRSWEVPE
jgi:methylated-DNA-protein-cysteine methyltransferase-like protein